MPISHSAKQTQVSRIKSKFKFLGKFMAKAIMDSRMVCIQKFSCFFYSKFRTIGMNSDIAFLCYLQLDLPFSVPFYRWLLYEDSSLSLSDLSTVAPEVQVTLKRLQKIVRERDEIMAHSALDQETKNIKVKIIIISLWHSIDLLKTII